MFNILLTPHTSCHRIKYFCLFRQVWLHITPDLFPLLLIVIDEQHWRIQCIRKTCTHFYICRVLFCCVVVSVDLIPPTSLAPSLWYGCPIARKGSPMLRGKNHRRALHTHDIAMTEQPKKQLDDVVGKCLDIIIMQSSQTPQPNLLVYKYGLRFLWKKTPSLRQYPGKSS